jgi:hypothetical protein
VRLGLGEHDHRHVLAVERDDLATGVADQLVGELEPVAEEGGREGERHPVERPLAGPGGVAAHADLDELGHRRRRG